MIQLKKWPVFFLQALLLLALISVLLLGLLLAADRQWLLESAVDLFTDFQLQISGNLELNLHGSQLSLEAGNVQLSNESGEQLFSASELRADASVSWSNLYASTINVLEISDATIWVIKHNNGQLNWQTKPPSETSTSSPGIRWDALFTVLQVENLTVELSGFSAKNQTVKLARLQSSQQGHRRALQLTGEFDGLPFSGQAEFQDLAGFILTDKELPLQASLQVAGSTLRLDGALAVQWQHSQLLVAFDAPTLNAATPWLPLVLPPPLHNDFPALENFSLAAQLTSDERFTGLKNLKLSVDGKHLRAVVAGSVGLQEGEAFSELDITAHSEQLSDLLPDRLGDWHDSSAHASFGLLWQQRTLQLDEVNAQLKSSRFDTALQASSVVLTHVHDISELHVQDADIKLTLVSDNKPLFYRYVADTLTAKVDEAANTKLETSGHYKEIELSVTGDWQRAGDYQFNLELAPARGADPALASIEGYVRDNQWQLLAQLHSPSLKPLAMLVDQPEVPVDQINVELDISGNDQRIGMDRLLVAMNYQTSKVSVNAAVNDLKAFRDYSFNIGANSDSLADLYGWINANAVAVEQTIDSLSKPAALAVRSESQGFISQASWLSDILNTVSLDKVLHDYPALNGSTVIDFHVLEKNNVITVPLKTLQVNSDLLSIDVDGTFAAGKQGFDIKGAVAAQLQAGSIGTLKVPISLRSDYAMPESKPLQLSGLSFIAGRSQGRGDLSVDLAAKVPLVRGELDIPLLDVNELLGVTKGTDEHADSSASSAAVNDAAGKNNTAENNAAEKKAASKSDNSAPIFSSEPIDLEWLPALDIDLSAQLATLHTPHFQMDDIKATINKRNDLARFNLQQSFIAGAPVIGSLQLDANDIPRYELTARIEDFDFAGLTMLKDSDPISEGGVDILVMLAAEGATPKALAQTIDGRVAMVARDAVLIGSELEQLSPDLFTELNNRLNPFARQDKRTGTLLECGLVYFDLNDGLMTADKSIVLVTPQIIFGANGAIDLGHEQLRLQVIPKPRKGLGFSIRGSLAKMAVLTGPIKNPSIEIDPKAALTSGSIDVVGTVLYGPVYWLYLGQAQKLLNSPEVCEESITRVVPEFSRHDAGASVKASAETAAP